MKKAKTPHELLQKALLRVSRRNKSYSLRSLARAVDISPSFLSAVFKGKKRLPKSRFEAVTRSLGMDEASKKSLRKAMLLETIGSSPNSVPFFEDVLSPSNLAIAEREEGTIPEFTVFDSWYHMAILDLVTCVNFNPDPKDIGSRLGIETREAERAFKMLADRGLIEFKNGIWLKVNEKLRFPTTKSYPAIRAYHKTMITKALQTLIGQTDTVSFERRLITAVSFAANPESLKKGRERLMELIYEIADIMTEGDCTEIYQLNAQLFPLTSKGS